MVYDRPQKTPLTRLHPIYRPDIPTTYFQTHLDIAPGHVGDVDTAVVELPDVLELEDELDELPIGPADPAGAAARGHAAEELLGLAEHVVGQLAEAPAEAAVGLAQPVVRGVVDAHAARALRLARRYRVPRYFLCNRAIEVVYSLGEISG